MPITPLHFGIATPLKVIRNDKFSVPAFIWANCLMDVEPVMKILVDFPGELHGMSHTFVGTVVMTCFCILWSYAAFWRGDPRIWRINEGFAWGVGTHVLVDALVHPDMSPFWPILGNPLYIGQIELISLVLWVLLAWGISFFTGPASERRHLALKRLERAHACFVELLGSKHG